MSRLIRGIVTFDVAILILMLAEKHGAMATYACSLNFTSCYTLIDVDATWSDAKDECERLGAYLFVPSVIGEEEFVYEYIGKKYDRDIWLGCSDDRDTRKYNCHHESINLTFHERWKDNAPNLGRDFNKDWALMVKPKDYPVGWEEKDRTTKLGYVCELPRPHPEQAVTQLTQVRTCSSGTYLALTNPVTGRPILNLCANGSPLGVVDPIKNVKRCGVACVRRPDCFSFNYIRVSEVVEEDGRCVLMGVVDGTLRDQQGCQYYTLV